MRLYCERISDGLTGEPFNVISNIGFFVAAFFLLQFYRSHRKEVPRMPEIATLIGMTVAIGIGSSIFHTFASFGSILFDVIPIAVFVLFFMYVFARDMLDMNADLSLGIVLVLVVVNVTYKSYVYRAIDGYVSYIPTFLFLLVIALYMLLKRHLSAVRIAFASTLAFGSLYFRTMDRPLCHMLPMGTHFIWHLLNAALIYLLVRELILHKALKFHGKR